ncbi:Uncharacterised protein [Acinetobacter baumannii]|nr:Uncharacterised protein [Acinetobacter baumannii]
MEQPHLFPVNLAAEQQVAAEIGGAAALLRLAVALDHLAHRFPHQRGRVVEAGSVEQVGAFGVLAAVQQQTDDALGGRQVAGALQHQRAIAVLLEHVQFAEGGNMVHPGVGARIGRKDQPGRQTHGHTVGHTTIPQNKTGTPPTHSVPKHFPSASGYWPVGIICTAAMALMSSQPPPNRMPRTGQASR